MTDPDIPYRTSVPNFTPAASVSSTDENEFSTLLQARNEFGEAIAQLHHWDAFDLEEKELTVKEQIKAHRVAYDILLPLYESFNDTVNQINAKYREK